MSDMTTLVLNGEVVVKWQFGYFKASHDQSPARLRIRQLEIEDNKLRQPAEYTIHKGQFRFFYRKTLSEVEPDRHHPRYRDAHTGHWRDTGGAPEELPDLADPRTGGGFKRDVEDDVDLMGEFFIDEKWRHKVARTMVVL